MGILRMGIMYLGFTALHFIQFILAIVVIGLYGVDINNPGDQNRYDSARWVRSLLASDSLDARGFPAISQS